MALTLKPRRSVVLPVVAAVFLMAILWFWGLSLNVSMIASASIVGGLVCLRYARPTDLYGGSSQGRAPMSPELAKAQLGSLSNTM